MKILVKQSHIKALDFREKKHILGALNINKDDLIIVYCHSGLHSAHTTFMLTQLLGYKNAKNYDGAWQNGVILMIYLFKMIV